MQIFRSGRFVTLLLLPAIAFAGLQQAQPPSQPQTVPATAPTDELAAKLMWPRTVELGGAKLVVYQPQLDKWEGNRLEARAAVAATAAGSERQSFGVVWLSARTDVDKDARLVTLEDFKVEKASFPQEPGNEQLYASMLQQRADDAVRVIPLDQLEATLAVTAAVQKARAVEVKNDPPHIIFSSKPAILILIDGAPVLKQMPESSIMRVVNTRALILQDPKTSSYYLFLMGKWVKSGSPMGPWVAATNVPAEFNQIKDYLAKGQDVDLYEPKNPEGAPAELPVVFTNDRPTELIQSRGEPQYIPIEGTGLLYMENTESAIFRLSQPSEFYLLVSGRWFKSRSLHGSWEHVPAKQLPADFAKIPADHVKANVLVSVPETPQATEALIANSIPQTATVKRSEATAEVEYDGEPKFQPIQGVQGLQYATNTPLPVILVDQSSTYYCVSDGVWFIATTPEGPWSVATEVPEIIYMIPASSSIHYVTYVRIYGFTDEVVYVGYTPGYMGTCVSDDGVVVYGTGYYYPAYVGSYWVGYPPTYGYGASFACGWWTGFSFGFAAGAIIGDCWGYPYWGPCWGYGSIDINSRSVYKNWRGGVTEVRRSYEYDGWTGESRSEGRRESFNPYTGRASVGGYSRYLDRSDGDFHAKRAGASYNPRTGTISGAGREMSGNIYDGDVDVDRAGFRYNTQRDSGVAYKDGDVYAGRDGNVYKRDDGSWQKYDNGSWNDVQRAGQLPAQQRQDLNRQRYSRDVGYERVNATRAAPRPQAPVRTAPVRTGGGMRGGGRGGRR